MQAPIALVGMPSQIGRLTPNLLGWLAPTLRNYALKLKISRGRRTSPIHPCSAAKVFVMHQPSHQLVRCSLVLAALLLVQGDGQSAEDPKRAGDGSRANRLARETSPYLLLHAHNPVDWYPWGPEAFEKAKKENKPIFLSIGYSSCYWCHVMERESFTDPEIARVLNEKFVAIKVDREERPDVDQVYMAALQMLGRGGWPMSMFLTPDGRPFFGGTYFPPRDREPYGGFLPLISDVARAWNSPRRRAEIEKSAASLTDAARQRLEAENRSLAAPLTIKPVADGLAEMASQFDPLHGGFGFDPQNPRRPKFPEPSNLFFLLDQHVRLSAARARLAAEKAAKSQNSKKDASILPVKEADKKSDQDSQPKDKDKEKDGEKDRKKEADKDKPADATPAEAEPVDPLVMLLTTLDHMARGGIRDHLAGGYHRYSTDRYWMVPHFEKMLYDNAQMASVHLATFEITKDSRWRQEAEATLQFIDRHMTSPEGGFFSALDAETQGEEGGYYVWTRDQIKSVVGSDASGDAFLRVYGVNGPSNFEGGRYVLRQPLTLGDQAEAFKTTPEQLEARLAPLKLRLLAARERRRPPMTDDKVLTGWNGLTIAAYADAYRLLGTEKYRRTAETAAQFVLTKLRTPTGRLLRTYRAGVAKIPAYLDDYAFLIHGLLRLHEATKEEKWLREARQLTDTMQSDFEDGKSGGFFFTSQAHDTLLARAKDPYDNVLPSGNSMAVLDLVSLSRATGAHAYLDRAAATLTAFGSPLSRKPVMLPAMLVGLEQYLDVRPTKDSTTATPALVMAREGEENQVKATAALDPATTAAEIAPGREVTIFVSVDVAQGWHIYGNPPGVVDLKPTTLDLDPASRELAQVLEVAYPVPRPTVLASLGNEQIGLYEGKLSFKVRLRLADKRASKNPSVKFLLNYQACNDRLCLAPSKVEIPFDLRVGR